MATKGYKRQRGLTVEQRNAIDLLVTGKPDREVAEAVAVNRVTVTKWRLHDPWFQTALEQRRQEIWGTSVDRLRALLPKALDALEAQLDGSNPMAAVHALFKALGLVGVGRSCGPTNAEAIVEARAQARFHQRIMGSDPLEPTDADRQAVLDEVDERLGVVE